MNRFLIWIHHFLNPHCEHCRNEKFESEVVVCHSCETLKTQLAIANNEKNQLLNTILSFTRKPEESPSVIVRPENVKPGMMTWRVRKQMLEAEDKKAAELLAEQRKRKDVVNEIEKLEKELELDTEVKIDA